MKQTTFFICACLVLVQLYSTAYASGDAPADEAVTDSTSINEPEVPSPEPISDVSNDETVSTKSASESDDSSTDSGDTVDEFATGETDNEKLYYEPIGPTKKGSFSKLIEFAKMFGWGMDWTN